MAHSTAQGRNLLKGWSRPGKFDENLAKLPAAYRKFWKEWKETEPAAVHFIPKTEKWHRDPLTNETKPVQNVPIPLKFPEQHDYGLWGGEGVIQGFVKRGEQDRRVAKFWVPVLKRTVVYSEIMDKYMATIVTERALQLIHESYGLDHYILKTLACDLKSRLAINLKRRLLLDLQGKCPAYADQPELQTEIYEKYKQYLTSYEPEDLEWYGLTMAQAFRKQKELADELNKPMPLKHKYRLELIEKLKKLDSAELEGVTQNDQLFGGTGGSWLKKINPFSKQSA